MSTLEKTISLLNEMPEKQIEIVYRYAQLLAAQQSETERKEEQVNHALEYLTGCLPDSGKTLGEYREERLSGGNSSFSQII